MDALPALGTASQAGQIGLGPRLVQKDQSGRVQGGLATTPLAAGSCYVRAVLLASPERLFLYVRPNFSSA